MQTNEILEAIDKQILQLQQVRALLAGDAVAPQTGKRRGRPKGSLSKATGLGSTSTFRPIKKSVPVRKKGARGTMSDEGRARIAAAQKARWAALKKAIKPAKAAVNKAAPSKAKEAAKFQPKSGKKPGAGTRRATVTSPAAKNSPVLATLDAVSTDA